MNDDWQRVIGELIDVPDSDHRRQVAIVIAENMIRAAAGGTAAGELEKLLQLPDGQLRLVRVPLYR